MVNSIDKVANNGGSNGAVAKEALAAGKTNFSQVLRNFVQPDRDNLVSEEELFAGLIQERILKVKGAEALSVYQKMLDQQKAKFMGSAGYVAIEPAARQALRDLVTSGVVTKAEANKIHSQSFVAAQMDNKVDRLWDGVGTKAHPTSARLPPDIAIMRARKVIGAYDRKRETAQSRPIDQDYGAFKEINNQ